MWSTATSFRVKLGGNYFVNCRSLISYKGDPLFNLVRREDGLLGIDFDIYDGAKNKIATIRRGTIVSGNRDDYEIVHKDGHYRVIEKQGGRVVCDIKRAGAAADSELEVSTDLYTPSGFHLLATPDHTNIGGVTLKGNTFEGGGVGIAVG